MKNTSDVKELIPEFYYSNEFLLNMNKLNLGKRADNIFVDNVVLPEWCK